VAEFFVDHAVYTTNIGATPTWAVPQEGDGSNKDAATASAVGSIQFNAVPTTGNFVICGVTFTSPAGVLGAANVGAAADALAGLINGSTTAVGVLVATGTPQLRNLVFARGPSGGAPAGTCQIMMRVGSTTLNHASNGNVAMSHTFNGTAPTLTQFIGGTGGCWGWLLNTSAIGVSSSIAVITYGLLRAKPMVWTATPTALDTIWARTASGKSITHVGTGSISRTETWPLVLLFDSNIKWTGDSGAGVVTLTLQINANNASLTLYPANDAGALAWIGAIEKGGLKIVGAVSGGNVNPYIVIAGSGSNGQGQMSYVNVDIDDTMGADGVLTLSTSAQYTGVVSGG
jgi:hypothetical protein